MLFLVPEEKGLVVGGRHLEWGMKEAGNEERKKNAASSGVERRTMMVDEDEQGGMIVVGADVVVGSIGGRLLKRNIIMVGGTNVMVVGGANIMVVGGGVAGVAAVGGDPNYK